MQSYESVQQASSVETADYVCCKGTGHLFFSCKQVYNSSYCACSLTCIDIFVPSFLLKKKKKERSFSFDICEAEISL